MSDAATNRVIQIGEMLKKREDEAKNPGNMKVAPVRKAPLISSREATENFFKAAGYMGISMPQRFKIPYVMYSLIVNGLGTFYLPLGFTLIFVMLEEVNPSEMGNLLTSLQVTFDLYGGSIKIVLMGFMLIKLRAANSILHDLDMRCSEEDELAEQRKVIAFGRKVVIIFLLIYFSYSASTFLGSVVMGHPPYSVYMPLIHWRRSTVEFVVASLLEFMMMNTACLQQTVNDTYGVIYVALLRSHMKILLLRVQKLGTRRELSLDQHLDELKLCIRDHKNLLKLYDVIAPIISITIFIQFTITSAIFGTTLVNMTIFATEFSAIVASCFYILAVLIQVFPICYFAQCLLNDSGRLSEVIFHSDWVDKDVRYRQMLIFFIQRAQRPMALNAGKLFPVSLNSFLSLAKFSFSLYTFIKEMNIKERLGLD